MIVEIAQNATSIDVSYVNADGLIDYLTINVADQPNMYPIWVTTDTPNPNFTAYKHWLHDKSVELAYAKRFNRFDLFEFLNKLDKNTKDTIFAYNSPKVYSHDIETNIGDSFASADTAEQPIVSISMTSDDINTPTVILTTYKLTDDDASHVAELVNKYAGHLVNDKIDVRVICVQDEFQLLKIYAQQIKQMPAITGWNWHNFDMKYIINRMKLYNLSFAISSPTHTVSYKKYPKHKIIEDYMQLVADYDYSTMPRDNMRLDYIASKVLSVGKLPNPYGNLKAMQTKDKPMFIAYNAIDTILVQLMHRKLQLFTNIQAMSHAAGLPITQCQSQVNQTEAIIMRYFLDTYGGKVVIAHDANQKMIIRPYEGGYVKEPILHHGKYVACLDYSSLYPSIFRTHNYGITNYVGRDFSKEQIAKFKADKNFTVSVMGSVYKNDKDYEYKIIESKLYDQRKKYQSDQFFYLNNHVQLIRKELVKRKLLSD
jgi:DNA polymerase elongation subunit (family B)